MPFAMQNKQPKNVDQTKTVSIRLKTTGVKTLVVPNTIGKSKMGDFCSSL
jgi:hypothetical protein